MASTLLQKTYYFKTLLTKAIFPLFGGYCYQQFGGNTMYDLFSDIEVPDNTIPSVTIYNDFNADVDHDGYVTAVNRAKKLFLDGFVVSLGLSGKDSGCAAVCIVEGLRQSCVENPERQFGPLYVVTTNTGIENIVLHEYMLELHQDLTDYAKENNLPIFTQELKPALASNPMVEYVGRGKLLRTPITASNGRDCAFGWKIQPVKQFLSKLKLKHQTEKIVSISGSRSSESKVRAHNLLKRKESSNKVVETELGLAMALIKDWTLNDVWSLFHLIDDDEIETFSERLNLMRKHYSAGNGGTCDLFAGNSADKACSARFGCMLCAMQPNDASLEAQVELDPKQYGFMKPVNKLRQFMINSLFDYRQRSILGRELKKGWIKIGYNQYSLNYRIQLLRYILSIQNDLYSTTGNHDITLIDVKELVAIQFHWSREGGEPEPGYAFKIWHEVYTEGQHYPVPTIPMSEQGQTPEYTYFPLGNYVSQEFTEGLDDPILFEQDCTAERFYIRNNEKHRVIRYNESQSFEVVTENGLAADFVECYYPDVLIAEGHLKDKCPTVMLKALLESGVVRLAKGQISRLNNDAKRAQAINSLRTDSKLNVEQIIQKLSVPKEVMSEIIAAENYFQSNSIQQSFF